MSDANAYIEAVEYIFALPKFTSKNSPEHTRELLRRLDHPEREMKVIHVAGSNGKGSVCAFINEMLVQAGKRTGLFTSPHLMKINERFQINGEPVSDDDFLTAYQAVMAVIQSMTAEGYAHPTFFETVFAIGLAIFRRQQVAYLILETGLGGRLDATNLVEHPQVSVITSISLEHTEILGGSIAEIAGEKAGIIKKGVPVIYDAGDPVAAEVIRKRAGSVGAKAIPLCDSMYEILRNTVKGIDFLLDCEYYEHTEVHIPYCAEYQIRNSALALLAMDIIDPQRQTSIPARVAAISKVKWPGRMETVLPDVIFDGAHNAQGIAEFTKTVRQLGRSVVLLFAVMAEKDYEAMIQKICEEIHLKAVIVTEAGGGRAVPAVKLQRIFAQYTDVPIAIKPDLIDAFKKGMDQKEEALFFCVGSLYLIGELKSIIKEYY